MFFIYISLSCTASQKSSDMVRFYCMVEGSGKQAESENFLWKIKHKFYLEIRILAVISQLRPTYSSE